MNVGILAVQGAFEEHKQMIKKLGVRCTLIRNKDNLNGIDGIILPGGESTVQGKLIKELGIYEPLKERIHMGLPVLATCAGLILLAQNIENDSVKHLETMPITVKRNAYGRQLGSFETVEDVGDITDFPLTFIRAPYVSKSGNDVDVLCRVDSKIVAVKYKNQIGLAFHPEMTKDMRIHQMFLDLIKKTDRKGECA